MLSQCTMRSQTLNTTIYGHVRDTITDLKLKEQETSEIDGNEIELLLNLRPAAARLISRCSWAPSTLSGVENGGS